MTGLSLFTGVGGMDLAFGAAGGRVIAMCERDEFCREILRRHWPNIPIHGDIRALRGEEIGAVDVIFGGFPCQPFSCAGSKKGKSDDRYLWPEFSRLVGEIEPAWVVGENVPGILRLAADDICEDLERQGYAVGILCYEAAAVGALHRRSRIFFVAHSGRTLQSRSAIGGTICSKYEREKTSDLERSGGAPFQTALGDAESQRLYYGRDGEAVGSGAGENHAPCGASTPVSNTASGGRGEGTEDKRRRGERSESRTRNRLAAVCPAISHPNSSRRLQQEGNVGEFRRRAYDICKKTVFDSYGKRFQEQQSGLPKNREREALESPECDCRRGLESSLGRMADGIPAWLDGTWWQSEPDIPRVAPRGNPHRVPRLKALGNAVVPAQIFPIFAAIAEIESE